MIIDVIFCGLIVCGGVIFAAHFPLAQRKAGLAVALLWAILWAIYNATWLPFSPHRFIPLNFTAYWSLLDLMFGAYVCERAIEYLWGSILFGLSILQLVCHIMFAYDMWNFYVYSTILDYFFYIQAMTFYINGAGGVGNRLFNTLNSIRNALGKSKTTQK